MPEPPTASRPAFALSFPSDPELDELVSAFGRGDYARVRAQGADLARRASDPRVAQAASELLKRLSPDPLMLYLMGVAGLLLVVLTIWALAVGRH